MTYKYFTKAPIVSLHQQPIILFDGQQDTLLEALEEKNVQIFSECRNGFCGACKTQVLSGEVSYIREPIAVLKADECLPCCCIPKTDLSLNLPTQGVKLIARPLKHKLKSQPQANTEHISSQSPTPHSSTTETLT